MKYLSDCLSISWLRDTLRQDRLVSACVHRTNNQPKVKSPSQRSITYKWKKFSPYIVLFTCFIANFTTFYASWSCDSFSTMPCSATLNSGGGFGVWTVMDADLQCQLWSTLFFAHSLEPFLQAAQICSMIAMLAGLASVVILAQFLCCRWVNWLCIFGFIVWTIDSYTNSLRYSLWSTFFTLSYVLFAAASQHLLTSLCSIMVQRRLIRFILEVATLASLGISLMLASDVCTSSYVKKVLHAWVLEQRTTLDDDTTTNYRYNPEDFVDCHDSCQLWGTTPVIAPVLWFGCWLIFTYCSVHTAKVSSTIDMESNNEVTAVTIHESGPPRRAGDHEWARASNGFIDLSAVNQSESWLAPEERTKSSENDTGTRTSLAVDLSSDPSIWNKLPEEASCDANVTPQLTIFERWFHYASRMILLILVLVYILIMVVMTGAYVENRNAAMAPDTSHNFVLESVCGFDPMDPTATYVTFTNKLEAVNAGFVVAHCGECARCSNPDDITTYVNTRTTIAKSAKMCSKTAIFGNRNELMDCLEEEIGFSRTCTECWADNMKTTAKYCAFTCLSSFLTGNTKNNNQDFADDYDWLNHCIFCDEKRSGPAFVQCSGVARRRLGIMSEIERRPAEQCQSVDVDYLNATSTTFYSSFYK